MPENPIVVDRSARFTVLAPQCIRMEYSSAGVFTDEPTLFAYRRDARCEDFTLRREGSAVEIQTAAMTLVYRPDGKPFGPANLQAKIRKGEQQVFWTPGAANGGNLRGPLSTLDNVSGPVPLPEGLLSRDGWYVVDDSNKAVLRDGWVAQGRVDKHADWYLFGYGEDYASALSALAAVSGAVPLPRKHVFGSWYCRWWDYTSDDYREIVCEYAEHDFPLDIMVMDMGWHRYDAPSGFGWAGNIGWSGFSWNRSLLPDVQKLLAEWKEQGIFCCLNVHPHDGIRNHEDCYPAFAKELGLAPGENPPLDAGSRAYMNAYFRHGHEPLERDGVDFWWIDWQQDSLMPFVHGVPQLRHLPWLNHLYYRHTARKGRRGMSFSRWAGWGDQRNPIQFSGDCGTNWETLRFEIDMTARSGNCGCFYWAHDLGGFWGKRDPEVYVRWVQYGVTNATLRLHSCGEDLDRRPWKWGEQAEAAMRKAFHLRSRLLPYVYSTAWQAHSRTLPLIRPMYLAWPGEQEAYANPQQFLFGDNLLVAPITSAGEGERKVASQVVWLPEGRWWSWFTCERFEGPTKVSAACDLETWPLLVRGGAVMPMQPYTPRMTTEPLTNLVLRCYPGEDACESSSELYEDDGQTDAYLSGRHGVTVLRHRRERLAATVTVDPTVGQFDGQVAERAITLELPGWPRIASATVDGRPAEVCAGEDGVQTIPAPTASIRSRRVFAFTLAEAP